MRDFGLETLKTMADGRANQQRSPRTAVSPTVARCLVRGACDLEGRRARSSGTARLTEQLNLASPVSAHFAWYYGGDLLQRTAEP
jgi:hypothetical protein